MKENPDSRRAVTEFSSSIRQLGATFAFCFVAICLIALGSNTGFAQQQQSVKGKVADGNGNGIPGVSVVVKGTSHGTITDIDGAYSISNINSESVLMYSFVGMSTQEIKVGAQSTIDVVMKEATFGVDEVVVVGYGVQKRSDITGSVTSVPAERLTRIPVTNIMHAIEGSTAGLNITQTSSVPGSTGNMQIRGVNSINASTSPFIVVDGIPFFGSTNDINPADVKSIEILKDASAVAIYGTRGANGVILITTKRGSDGKPVVRYNGHAGIEQLANVLEPSSPEAYLQKYKDYLKERNLPQTNILDNTYEIQNYNAGITTDWLDEVTKTGVIQDHNVSLSGGNEDARYYLSGGYMKQDGVVKGYQYRRISVMSNLDLKVTDYLKVGTSLGFADNNYDGGRLNLLDATAMSPYSRPFDDNGNIIIYPMYPELLWANPFLGTMQERISRGKKLTGNGYLELAPKIIPGLKYRLNASYITALTDDRLYSGRSANDLVGSGSAEKSERNNWVIENILTYNKDFGVHHIDVTALYSAQEENYFASGAFANTFINDQLSFYNLGAGANQSSSSSGYKTNLISQMGRINYSYDSRYLLTITARRDGYSAFGANTNKFGVFPSFALGWNIHKENFMASASEVVNNLKLRVSYGKVGNQAIDANQTSTLANSVRFPFNGVSTIGVLASSLGNANLHWESTTAANLGLDFNLFKNRIAGTIEVYQTKTEDILLRRNLPIITGYYNIWDNLGAMQNKGIEITLNTVNVHVGDFSWESNINFSMNRNKILELYGDGKDDVGNRWFIGKPLNVIYDYEKVGVWQVGENAAGWDPSAKPGYLKFKDQLTKDTNGDGIPDATDGVINSDDRVILGTTAPDWYGGITNTLNYKNFHLSFFIQTVQGVMKNNRDMNYVDEAGRRNVPADFQYWTEENKNNEWPGLYSNNRGYGFPCDASFTRLKDVTLSYNVPKNFCERIGMADCSLYVSGRNLYTLTDWFGWDPENNYSPRGSGDWRINYPAVKNIVLGLNITLR